MMPSDPYASNPNRLLLPSRRHDDRLRLERRRHPVLEGIRSVHRVPRDQPDLLVPLPHILHRHVPPVLRHSPARPHDIRTRHVPHAVHHVRPQHHQVLRPRTMVALPLAAQRLQLPDSPILDHRLGPLLIRVRPPVRHGHPRPRPLARLQHGVRIRQRPRKRLLAEDVP